MSVPLVAALVWLLVASWAVLLAHRRAQLRRISACMAELAELHAMLTRAQELVLSRRGPDGREDEAVVTEYRRLMAEYEARYERLRADCDKHGLHLPERPWRQR